MNFNTAPSYSIKGTGKKGRILIIQQSMSLLGRIMQVQVQCTTLSKRSSEAKVKSMELELPGASISTTESRKLRAQTIIKTIRMKLESKTLCPEVASNMCTILIRTLQCMSRNPTLSSRKSPTSLRDQGIRALLKPSRKTQDQLIMKTLPALSNNPGEANLVVTRDFQRPSSVPRDQEIMKWPLIKYSLSHKALSLELNAIQWSNSVHQHVR